MWSVNDEDRTYTELDKKEAERVAGLVNAKIAALEGKLEEDLTEVERLETEDLIQGTRRRPLPRPASRK